MSPKRQGVAVYGVNTADQINTKAKDMHCPLMDSARLNYWKEMCEIRQKDDKIKSCYGGCNYIKGIEKGKKMDMTQEQRVLAVRALVKTGMRRIDMAEELGVVEGSIYKYLRIIKAEDAK